MYGIAPIVVTHTRILAVNVTHTHSPRDIIPRMARLLGAIHCCGYVNQNIKFFKPQKETNAVIACQSSLWSNILTSYGEWQRDWPDDATATGVYACGAKSCSMALKNERPDIAFIPTGP